MPHLSGRDHTRGVIEVEERFRAVDHNYPGVLEEMRPTLQDIRTAETKYGIRTAPGQSNAELPILSVKGLLITAAVENFARKLFCALYYRHTLIVLPTTGGIAVKWWTNLQIETEAIPRQLASLLSGVPSLERARTNLDEQFFYRFGLSETKATAGFLVLQAIICHSRPC